MKTGPVGGHTSVGAMPRSYQATPAGLARPGAGKKHAVHERHRGYEPNPRTQTSLTLTDATDAMKTSHPTVDFPTPGGPQITITSGAATR